MIEPISGLGVADTARIAELHAGGAPLGPGNVAESDIARFEAAMEGGTPPVVNTANAPGPAETTLVADSGDSWVLPPVAAPADTVEAPAPSLHDRLAAGISDLRDAANVFEANINTADLDSITPGKMITLMAQITSANATVHLVTAEVGRLIGKVDDLLKTG